MRNLLKKKFFLAALVVITLLLFTGFGSSEGGGGGKSGKYKMYYGNEVNNTKLKSQFGITLNPGQGQIVKFSLSNWNKICTEFKGNQFTGQPLSMIKTGLNQQKDKGWITQKEIDQILKDLDANGRVLFVKQTNVRVLGVNLWVFDMYAKE